MEIHDRARVNAAAEQVWEALVDVERIAPCLPGATMDAREGDELRGRVKVKVGPIQAEYRGVATVESVDPSARRMVVQAKGRESRGQGNARASIAVQVADADQAGVSTVTIDTELDVTGRVAQLGRGVLADVSTKLLAAFAENLEAELARVPAPASGTAPETPSPERVEAPAPERAEAVDLVELGAASVARRLVPALLVVLGAVVLWRMVRHRGAGDP